MSRTFKTLTTVCLGALLLTTVACEDKETQEALKTCKNDLSSAQKTEAAQMTSINDLKAQLASAQAKIGEMTKEADMAKNAKGGKPADDKAKPEKEVAKGDKGAKKEKKVAKK